MASNELNVSINVSHIEPDGEYEGTMYRVTVSTYDATVTDWKSIAEKLEPSRQLIAGNQSTQTRTKICVVAKSDRK
jgi:hypothetical protein